MSLAMPTADGSNERLLNEVLASRLRYRTLTIVKFQAFIGCGLLLGLTVHVYSVAYIRTIFMCVLHTTFPVIIKRMRMYY